MSYWLGRTARELRERHEVTMLDVAIRAGVSESVISRFEAGQGWRRKTDEIVTAYAAEIGIDPTDIWATALQSWRADRGV